MNIISIVISAFIILEILNVLILYFAPESKKGNGLGIFKAYEKSKEIPEVHTLIKYLVSWVAGTKLIFIALLVLILIKGDVSLQRLSLLALVLTISTFYWKLFPLIKKMDSNNQLDPKGYSKTLVIMITSFITIFILVYLSNNV